MSHEQDKQNNLDVAASKQVRRTFLKRASAGVIVASIPAKSVWATGITNSIVASGHGSDFAGGQDIKLLSPCSILTVLSGNPGANLDLNFLQVFGEGPDQKFSEILSCHCGCPTTIAHGISNVVFRVQTSGDSYLRIKVDEYDKAHGSNIKDPNHPTRYYAYLSKYGTVVDYVIKASTSYYNQQGEEVFIGSPSWYTGFNKSNIDESFNASSLTGANLSASNNCKGDETTLAMIAIYLNARFDLYFRNGTPPTKSWEGSDGIYYPILSSAANVTNLVASIKTSKNQLIDILSQYDAIDPPLFCS